MSERFLAPCFIVVDVLLIILLNVFYVNDEPESKFLYTVTIELHCIVLSKLLQTATVYVTV